MQFFFVSMKLHHAPPFSLFFATLSVDVMLVSLCGITNGMMLKSNSSLKK